MITYFYSLLNSPPKGYDDNMATVTVPVLMIKVSILNDAVAVLHGTLCKLEYLN